MTKTTEEIEHLKECWESDPCWDIEDTEGFEDHREELEAYSELKKVEWHEKSTQTLKDMAIKLGCPDSLQLAAYMISLECQIRNLEYQVEKLEDRLIKEKRV